MSQPDPTPDAAHRRRWNGLWRRGAGTPDDPDNGRLIFRLIGLDAVLYCRHFDTPAATLRGVWWWVVRRYEAELCQRCGRPVGLVYHAPDYLWKLATGLPRRPDGEAAPGVLCPQCMDALVEPKIDGYLTWTCAVTK